MPFVGTAPDRQIPQPAEAVALPVDRLPLRIGPFGKQQAPIFRHAQEQQPVHQSQQLLEESLGAELVALQLGDQRLVVAVLQHPIGQVLQSQLHPIAQLVEGPLAGLLALRLPAVQHTFALAIALQATGLEQQPQDGELIEQPAVEELIQGDRHIGRLHQGRVVVQQPDRGAITEHAPVGRVVRIEAFLQAAMGGPAPVVLPKLFVALIQLFTRQTGEHQRYRAPEGAVIDRETRLADLAWITGLQIPPAEHLLQQPLAEMHPNG